MPKLTVDGIELEVPQGATVLQVSELAGWASGAMSRFALTLAALAMPVATAAAPPALTEPSTPAARTTLDEAARCIAKASPEASADLLTMDFRTTAYRNKMDRVIESNRRCIKSKWVRTNRLLLAGALAETLLEADAAPLNARLVKHGATSKAQPLSPSDRVAMCVARSDPDGTARLFATAPGSTEEGAAAQALAMVTGRCSEGGPQLSLSSAGLRSMLATASYRLLAAQEI